MADPIDSGAFRALIYLGDFPRHQVFESDTFVVLTNDSHEVPMYEIVQKVTNRHSFLIGVQANCLRHQTMVWMKDPQEQPVVEAYLDELTWLGSLPMFIH